MKTIPYSPGLENVIAGRSAICEVGPTSGELIYRGYDIHELAKQSTFEEVAYLLLVDRLPNKKELEEFSTELSENRDLPDELLDFFYKIPLETHPMDVLRTSVSIIGLYDPDVSDNSQEANVRKAIRLIAKIPTIITSCYRIFNGLNPIDPEPNLSHAKNFLYMLNSKIPDAYTAKVLDTSLILYAEHEFNASTFSARVTASTLSDMHSAITSAIGTLKGPLHGGANERVMRMLLEIDDINKAESWVKNALAQKKRIMGFGHRVYKKRDSRSDVVKRLSKELGFRKGQTKWYEMSKIIEDVMRREKGLFPNLDFYTASVYYLLGLPIELYSPIFVSSRITGWVAHVIEQQEDNRLIRPICEYRGPKGLEYIPLDQRT